MDEATTMTEVRVATLNLWGRRGAWEERRRVLADGFRELRPDLVAFQEAIVTEGYTTRSRTSSARATTSLTRQSGRKAGAVTSKAGRVFPSQAAGR